RAIANLFLELGLTRSTGYLFGEMSPCFGDAIQLRTVIGVAQELRIGLSLVGQLHITSAALFWSFCFIAHDDSPSHLAPIAHVFRVFRSSCFDALLFRKTLGGGFG